MDGIKILPDTFIALMREKGRTLPPLTVMGPLNLREENIQDLPDHLTVDGDLLITDQQVIERRIKVTGRVKILRLSEFHPGLNQVHPGELSFDDAKGE
jgi:hypothetical protein